MLFRSLLHATFYLLYLFPGIGNLTLHLENFFDAVRGKAKLSCPAEIGYETAVTVLKVNEAVEASRKLEFKPDEF